MSNSPSRKLVPPLHKLKAHVAKSPRIGTISISSSESDEEKVEKMPRRIKSRSSVHEIKKLESYVDSPKYVVLFKKSCFDSSFNDVF